MITGLIYKLHKLFLLQVLVIGCGDGGLVQEITKHPLVESITLCEIDQVKEFQMHFCLFFSEFELIQDYH